MDYIQILVVHRKGVYNFMSVILEAQVSFIFSLLCILIKNLFQILAIFKPYTVVVETSIEKALNANECVRWSETFIANLGHPLWGSQSMQELASEMRNERHPCLQNYTYKIVHSSAMHFQHLNVIHKPIVKSY